MDGHETSGKEGIKHGLDQGAAGGLLGRCPGIREEEATRGGGEPDFRGDGDRSSGADSLTCDNGSHGAGRNGRGGGV